MSNVAQMRERQGKSFHTLEGSSNPTHGVGGRKEASQPKAKPSIVKIDKLNTEVCAWH